MKKKKKFIEYKFLGKKKKLRFVLGEYESNGNLYVGLEDQNGELFTDVSCNHVKLGKNEIYVGHDMIDLCDGLLDILLKECILWNRAGYYLVNVDKIENEYEYDYYA